MQYYRSGSDDESIRFVRLVLQSSLIQNERPNVSRRMITSETETHSYFGIEPVFIYCASVALLVCCCIFFIFRLNRTIKLKFRRLRTVMADLQKKKKKIRLYRTNWFVFFFKSCYSCFEIGPTHSRIRRAISKHRHGPSKIVRFQCVPYSTGFSCHHKRRKVHKRNVRNRIVR